MLSSEESRSGTASVKNEKELRVYEVTGSSIWAEEFARIVRSSVHMACDVLSLRLNQVWRIPKD